MPSMEHVHVFRVRSKSQNDEKWITELELFEPGSLLIIHPKVMCVGFFCCYLSEALGPIGNISEE